MCPASFDKERTQWQRRCTLPRPCVTPNYAGFGSLRQTRLRQTAKFSPNKHFVSFLKAGVICCTATPLNNLSVYLHNQGNCEGGICPTIYPPYVCAGKERVYVLRRVVVQFAVSSTDKTTPDGKALAVVYAQSSSAHSKTVFVRLHKNFPQKMTKYFSVKNIMSAIQLDNIVCYYARAIEQMFNLETRG